MKLTIFAFVVSAAVAAAPAVAEPIGLRGEYYAGQREGYPQLPSNLKLVRVDGAIAFTLTAADGYQYWSLPSGTTAGTFTVRWTGRLDAAVLGGRYTFRVETLQPGAVLSVDGAVVVDLRGAAGGADTASVSLGPGPHFIELYYKSGSGSRIRFTASGPDGRGVVFHPTPRLGDPVVSVNFDDTAVRTYVTTQYSAQGVRFVPSIQTAGFTSRPRVLAAGGTVETSSGPHYLYNDSADPLEPIEASAGTPLTLAFSRLQRMVSMEVGAPQNWGPSAVTGILRAYDAEGRVVGGDRVERLAEDVVKHVWIARSTPDIAMVTLDYGDFVYGEAIDDLRLQTTDAAPSPVDRTRPVVTILSPREGDRIDTVGGISVTARVTEESGLLEDVTLRAEPLGVDGFLSRLPATGSCPRPRCFDYGGGVGVPPGAHTLTLTVAARDGGGNVGQASVHVTVDATGNVTRVRVSLDGESVPGALVYVNGRAFGVTDSRGLFETTLLPAGTEIIARKRVHQQRSPRDASRSASNWNYRVYLTSVPVADDGTFSPHVVSRPGDVQEIVLRRDSVLIGLHLVLSLEWDASQGELEGYRDDFVKVASSYLYNATDGQFFIEYAEIVDDAARWGATDVRFYASNGVWPHVDMRRGGFLHGDNPWPTYIHMPSRMSFNTPNDGNVLAHEFGHYGLNLGDEYKRGDALNSAPIDCTLAFGVGAPAPYGPGHPKSACMMNKQSLSSKLCSARRENPHVHGTRQGDRSCWDTIVDNYRDTAESPRWQLKTPSQRADIVGAVAGPPVPEWVPRVELENSERAGLCRPVTWRLVWGGRRIPGAHVWLQTEDRTLYAGLTGGRDAVDNTITVSGLHLGDRIFARGLSLGGPALPGGSVLLGELVIGPEQCVRTR